MCSNNNRSDGLDLCLKYKLKDSNDYSEMTFGDLDVSGKFGLLVNNVSGPIKL